MERSSSSPDEESIVGGEALTLQFWRRVVFGSRALGGCTMTIEMATS